MGIEKSNLENSRFICGGVKTNFMDFLLILQDIKSKNFELEWNDFLKMYLVLF